jgi:hypothetical protein
VKRISSLGGWAMVKWIMPSLVLAWVLILVLVYSFSEDRPPFVIVVGFACFVLLWAMHYARRVWPVARAVDDAGDNLVVQRGRTVVQIAIADVINVDQSSMVIRLRLRQPGVYGDEVAFLPRTGWFTDPFGRHAVAEDLLVRMDKARRGGGA